MGGCWPGQAAAGNAPGKAAAENNHILMDMMQEMTGYMYFVKAQL